MTGHLPATRSRVGLHRGEFFALTGFQRQDATALAEASMKSHQQGVWEMRFILGLIVGVVLMIGCAWIHDNVGSGASKPLVNWTTANEMQQATFDYVRSQIDRLMSMIKGETST